MPSLPKHITIGEAAARYAVSTKTIRRRISDGTLPAVYASKRLIRVREDHVDALFRPIPTTSRLAVAA